MQASRLEKLHDFLQNEPDDPFLKYALATEYLSLDKRETALTYFEDLLKNHPDYLGTYYHLGRLYEELARKQEALVIYESGMRLARKLNDMHAFSELQHVYNSAVGLDYDDD